MDELNYGVIKEYDNYDYGMNLLQMRLTDLF